MRLVGCGHVKTLSVRCSLLVVQHNQWVRPSFEAGAQGVSGQGPVATAQTQMPQHVPRTG